MPMLALVTAAVALSPAQAAPIEVPFHIADDAMIVDAEVNGRKVSLMFDTGFSGSVVLNDTINIGPATGTMTLQDFVGTFQAKTVKMKTLKLGDKPVNAEGMEVVQQPMAHMSFSYNMHTDGIMGYEVIRNYVTEINFEKSKFIFYPKTFDITKRTPDNKKTFLLRMLPMGHKSIDLEVVVENGKKMILSLDTGNAFYATTHKDVLQRVGLWEENKKPRFMKSAWVASGPVDSWYKEMRNLTIYGVPVDYSVWSIIDLPSSSAEGDGTIGFGFLKNFNIIMDYDRRRVWLDNFNGKVSNEPVADVGIVASYDARRKRVRIHRVSPEGPADKAGIKEGDELLAVNGEELGAVSYRRLQSLLEGETGSKVRLAVSRNGNLMRYELERVALVNPYSLVSR
jgi:hypothetical protein